MQITAHPVKTDSNFTPQRVPLRTGDAAMLQSILGDRLYTNVLRVVIQEYSSNGRDAHRAKGNAYRPIEIKLPGKLDPNLVMRDYGEGMTKDKMINVFVEYGTSDKRNDNNLTGGFGIGAKCGTSYAPTVVITTIVKERFPKDESEFAEMEDQVWKYTWVMCIESSGLRALNLINEERAEGLETGTAICISIKAEDFGTCATYVKELFRRWDPRPLIVGDLPLMVNQDVASDTSIYADLEREQLYALHIPEGLEDDPQAIKAAEAERAQRILEAAKSDPRIMEFQWETEDPGAIDIEGIGGCRSGLAPQLVGNTWVGYVDGLPYRIDTQLKGCEMPYNCGYLIFKTGEIEVNANREEIRNTKSNTEMVQQRLAELVTRLQVIAEKAFNNRIFFGNPDVRGVIWNLVAYDKFRLLRDLGFTPWEADGHMSLQTSEYNKARRANVCTVKTPRKSQEGAAMEWFSLCGNPTSRKLITLVAPKVGWAGLKEKLTEHIRNRGTSFTGRRSDQDVEILILRMSTPEGFQYLKQFCGPDVLIIEAVPRAKAVRAARNTGSKRVYNIGRGKWALVEPSRLEGQRLAQLVDGDDGKVMVIVDGVQKPVNTYDLDRYFEWIKTERFTYACRKKTLKQLTSYVVPSLNSAEYREALIRVKTKEKNEELGESLFSVFLDKVESTSYKFYEDRGLQSAAAIFGFDGTSVAANSSKLVRVLKTVTRRFNRHQTLSLILAKVKEDSDTDDRNNVKEHFTAFLPDINKLDPLAGSYLKDILK